MNKMAIDILKRGTKHLEKSKVCCNNCDSELQYSKDDVKVFAEDRPYRLYKEFLVCPVCAHEIKLCVYSDPD